MRTPATVMSSKRHHCAQAQDILRNGGIIAYPTESVWGLGCDPMQAPAVRTLLRIKQRSEERGLIVVASTIAQLDAWIDRSTVPEFRWNAICQMWPGPHTWIFPATHYVPPWIRGKHASVAVRVSAHPVIQCLCTYWKAPLVSTSANITGQPPPHALDAISPMIIDSIDAVIEGQTGNLAQPTSIRDAYTGETLRP